MEKKFKLPKDFAIKWVEALRSGKYKQATGILMRRLIPESTDEISNFGFCCLGVGAHLCGHTKESVKNHNYLWEDLKTDEHNIPLELISPKNGKNNLVAILTNLNDGLYVSDYLQLELKNYNYRSPNMFQELFKEVPEKVYFTFNQIADFIEDNCEFYDTPLFSDEELLQK